MSTTNTPIEKISVGLVHVAIWKNESKHGPFYSAKLERVYKDGDTWKTTDTYGAKELLHLAKAALQAHSAIGRLTYTARSQDSTTDGA